MEVYRIYSPSLLWGGIADYYKDFRGLDPVKWVENLDNIALTNSNLDISMFEYKQHGIYSGHYFFKSRGRQAIAAAYEMLDFFFSHEEYDIKHLTGLVPLETLGARWLTRHLGFKSLGVTDTLIGPCELFYMTPQMWEEKINEGT